MSRTDAQIAQLARRRTRAAQPKPRPAAPTWDDRDLEAGHLDMGHSGPAADCYICQAARAGVA